MLRKLFRPSRLQLRPLARSRLDPFLLRIRQSLEEYAEYLDKGDPPNPEDNTPIVYSGPDTELDALSKAIPEHPKEEEYLVQRWEMLINQVENSRLAYFDNLYGTRTYYQPTLPGQERVAVDKILDRSISRNKIDRLTKRETLFEDVESRLKDVLLKKEIDIEENQLHNFQEKLLQIPSTVYDPLGRPYKDNYGYLKPSGMQQDDMGVLIRYMELENERYLLNTHKAGNNIFRSTIEDIAETNSKATFFRLAPCLGKEYLYFYSEELKSVAKVKIRDISDYLSSDNSKNLMDQLQAKGLLKQTQEQSAEEINRALRAAKASVDVSAVVSLEDLREYFFNFKDKTSFAICKYLQFNAFTSKNINFLSVDQTERFLTVTLLANDAYLTVVLDLESRKAFSHYFLDNVHPQICVQQEENGVAIYRALFHDKGIAVWRHQVDSFIACKAKEEEITSLVKYMSENQESLIDNSALFAKGEVLHSFLGAKDMEIKQRKGSIDVSCWRGDNQIDTYEIKDSKGLKPVGGSRTPFGDTSSQRYEIQLKASSTIIKRSPLAKPHWGKPSSGEVKEIKLNFPIKSAVFLDDFVGLVVHSSKSNSDELVCSLDANQISVTKTQR
jgi:hypothetical protein